MEEHKISLLFDLEEKHYDDVFFEIKDAKDAHFHYIIDNDEIANFILPYTTKSEFENLYNEQERSETKKNISYIADEQFIIHYILNITNSAPTLPSEYLVELEGLRIHLNRMGIAATDFIRILSNYTTKYFEKGYLTDENEKRLLAILDRNSVLLVAFSIGLVDNGINKLIKLFSDHKVLFEENKWDSFPGLKSYLQSHDLKSERFYKIYNFLATKTQKLKFKNEWERKKKESADERDALVIEKITVANEYLKKLFLCGDLKQQSYLIYLSSTSRSNSLYYNSNLRSELLIEIEGKKFTPLRNSAQLYLKYIYEQFDSPYGKDKALDRLKNLKNDLLALRYFKDKYDDISMNEEVGKVLYNNLNHSRQVVENYSILANFSNFQPLLSQAVETLKNINTDRNSVSILSNPEISDAIQKLIEEGKKQESNVLKGLISLCNLNIMRKFVEYFDDSLKYLEEIGEDKLPIVHFKDKISSRIQRLPFLYLMDGIEFQQIIAKLSNYHITKPFLQAKEYYDFLANEVRNYLNKLQQSIKQYILHALILLVMPDRKEDRHITTVYQWAKEIFELYIQQKFGEDKAYVIIEQDIRYFIIWVGRLAGNYSDSLEFALKSINRFPNDARFYHGLSLIYYSLFHHSKKEKNVLLNWIKGAISNSEKAVTLYPLLKFYDIELLNKTVQSLNNSIAFFKIEMFLLSEQKEHKLLVEARSLIDLLKEREANFRSYHEYLHTEASLELYEAIQILNKYQNEQEREIQNRLKKTYLDKITSASENITEALVGLNTQKGTPRYSNYLSLRAEIEQYINKLDVV